MTNNIIINPVTRISGFMEIAVTVENNKVVDAKTEGVMFRGFEKILNDRNPFDAIYITERICGICSTAHSIASTIALENALNVVPSQQGIYLRDIMHGCEYLQNHIRHFYQYTIPDYVQLPKSYTLFDTEHYDYRLPNTVNDLITKHYFEAMEYSRNAHQMVAVLGGKAPHNHGVFLGGITAPPTVDKIIKIKSILNSINNFIEEKMIPDIYMISEYYKDYFNIGGGYGNFLSFGVFNNYKELGTLYVNPSTYSEGKFEPFNQDGITEEIENAYYYDKLQSIKPYESIADADMDKPDAYSWVKAARYYNKPFETGPLARQWLSGEYTNGISAMDRTIARALEAKKVCEVLSILIENVIPNVEMQSKYEVPETAIGAGLVDTTRGSLGHWLKINNSVISFYQIITPSVWNVSSKSNNLYGTSEQALMGTRISNTNQPVEIGRIIRSFDPCISCATHVYSEGELKKTIKVIPW